MIICQDGSLVNPYQVFGYELLITEPGNLLSEGTRLIAHKGNGTHCCLVKDIPADLAPAILARLAARLQEPGVIRIMDIVKEVQEGSK